MTTKPEPTPDWAEQKAAELLDDEKFRWLKQVYPEQATLRSEVAEALRLARANALEEACVAICLMCADGKYEALRCTNHWHHFAEDPSEEGGITQVGFCEAWKIRNLKEQVR